MISMALQCAVYGFLCAVILSVLCSNTILNKVLSRAPGFVIVILFTGMLVSGVMFVASWFVYLVLWFVGVRL